VADLPDIRFPTCYTGDRVDTTFVVGGGRGCVPGGFGELCDAVVAFEGDINVCVFENIGDFSDLW
jgi:hypothetical protein